MLQKLNINAPQSKKSVFFSFSAGEESGGSKIQTGQGIWLGQETSCYGRQGQKRRWQQSLLDTTQLLQVWPRQRMPVWTTVGMEIYI